MINVRIWLPFPPTVNNYYVQTRNGRFISKKGKHFISAVGEKCIEQGVSNLHLIDKLSVSVVLFMPDKRKRDLDNYKKALLDSITKAGVWMDDSQIDQLHSYRGGVIKDGATIIQIEEAGMVVPWKHEDIVLG